MIDYGHIQAEINNLKANRDSAVIDKIKAEQAYNIYTQLLSRLESALDKQRVEDEKNE